MQKLEIIDQAHRTVSERSEDDGERGVGLCLPTNREVAEQIDKLGPVWNELFPAEQHRVFQSLVERVVVSQSGVDIIVRADACQS